MSTIDFVIHAELRTDTGKGASRRLRRAEKVPAILYGADKEAVSITLDHNKVNNMADHEAFYSHILTLVIDGKKHEAILKDVQRHPYKPKLTHLDFQRVVKGQKLHTHVPVHFINEEAVVKKGGAVAHHVSEIEVSCLPSQLPEFIEVDLTNVELGQTLHLSDITLPEGVSSIELAKGESHDLAVVTIKAAKGKAADEAADEESDAE